MSSIDSPRSPLKEQPSQPQRSWFERRTAVVALSASMLIAAAIIAVPLAIVLSRRSNAPAQDCPVSRFALDSSYKPPVSAVAKDAQPAVSPNPAAPQTLLWPLPRSVSFGSDATARVEVVPSALTFALSSTSAKSDRLKRAFNRFAERFPGAGCEAKPGSSAKVLQRVVVEIKTGDEVKIAAASEGYTLTIPADGKEATIKAETVVGALRALETLTQLVVPNSRIPPFVRWNQACKDLEARKDYTPGFYIPSLPITIEDSPAYPHRGLLIDSSRHFIPLQSIYRTINALAAAKMNVLHWHLVDSQSFPVRSEVLPQLANAGAYSPYQTYTLEELRAVVSYAEDRGVRIVPEFDMPGHAYSWGKGMPGLVVCAGKMPWTKYCAAPPCGQLDITNDTNVQTVAALVREMASIFPDPLFHLGTDEVNSACYTEDPGVSAYLSRTGKDVHAIISDFLAPLHQQLGLVGKTPMHWAEALLKHKATLGKNTVVQIWEKSDGAAEATAAGYSVVRSDYESLYLDCGAGGWLQGGGNSWCDPYKTWQMVYMFDPLSNVTAENHGKVLGGEVALWMEQTEAHSMDGKIWPRAAAAAESWWSFSNSTQKKLPDALARLSVFADRLVRMGVFSGPLQPEWCVLNGGCA
ncbi:N-acetyl-glucosamine-6-phosphate deacetylase [Phlyctochytrium bullatum]|nr:N-acetyl-glucosamine-6-phosphate deacetylase [Phlyctochytrium bullatum]